MAFEFVPDGKPSRTTDADDSVAVVRPDINVLIFHRLSKSKEWNTMREELSADGNTLSDTDSELLDSGGRDIVNTTSVRVGAGTGFAR